MNSTYYTDNRQGVPRIFIFFDCLAIKKIAGNDSKFFFFFVFFTESFLTFFFLTEEGVGDTQTFDTRRGW
nr:MAG TPA: hypothetical protein [Caudoviricetes sp.]